MRKIEECEYCCRKFTTLGCTGCKINSIKKIKQKIENTPIKKIINFKFIINRIYARDILKNIDFNGFDYVITNKLNEDEMLLIVEKDFFKRKVGEYVRTDKGKITKIIGTDEFIEDDGTTFYETTENPGYADLCSKNIVKYSKNIIDLIEIGDYINGEKVIETHKDLGYIFVDKETELGTKTFCDYQIESIVTKEQFKEIEYKI